MAVTSEVRVEAQMEEYADKKPLSRVILQLMRSKPLGAAGGFIVLFMILMAVFAPVLTPYDPVANSFAAMTQAPSGSTGSAPTSSAAISWRASSTAHAPPSSSAFPRPSSAPPRGWCWVSAAPISVAASIWFSSASWTSSWPSR